MKLLKFIVQKKEKFKKMNKIGMGYLNSEKLFMK